MKSGAPETRLEARIDAAANRLLGDAPQTGWRSGLVEFLVFGAKQAWACVFGFLMLALILTLKVAAPAGIGPVAHNDLVTIGAVLIQLGMVLFGLETLRELRVIVLFHVVGTVMELFKTGIGAWLYPGPGILHIGAVPLYSGFMYAAVGSYLVRVYRLFDLRFVRYPWRWLTAAIAGAIYLNFFTHHWIVDLRWVLLAAVLAAFGPCVMHFRVFRRGVRMPLVLAFGLVAVFIWIGENLATFGGAWAYPDQLAGWHPVTPAKIVSWFLLMIISVVLVAWVYPPRRPEPAPAPAAEPVGPVTGPTPSVGAA
ncbi:DUF817 domain-containing protein [Gryllotalpicola protaetiae]|uniref:DUF817 domain-containing protein n=1 Tax=Gryllotalpicola protaetiae TaxID=2419771 RepID=A0A387BNN7_9MICO|nr:DUF817 domain-containing protein [Gryllotalpicola protaetiae]AYG02607.1 DUF817 domain-containing protein [Gryllotalpicola protaetiae]